jgi:hypothetical protein
MQASELTAELLGPRLTKGEARPLENQPKRHFRAAGRNLARFAADLRRLQDGEAHLTRGFSSFGAYAEHVFDGLSAANAKKVSVQGAVLLALERHGRIALDDQTSQLPGATGLRALTVVMSQHGENTMIAIYDRARLLRTGPRRRRPDRQPRRPRPAHATANARRRGRCTRHSACRRHVERAGRRGRRPGADDEDDPDEDPEAVHELHDRLIEIRRVLDDLGAVTSELSAVRGRKEAQRILTDLLEEIHELPHALAAAIASQHPE